MAGPKMPMGGKKGGPGKFQKPKNTKKTVSRLFGYLAKRKWLLVLIKIPIGHLILR